MLYVDLIRDIIAVKIQNLLYNRTLSQFFIPKDFFYVYSGL